MADAVDVVIAGGGPAGATLAILLAFAASIGAAFFGAAFTASIGAAFFGAGFAASIDSGTTIASARGYDRCGFSTSSATVESCS